MNISKKPTKVGTRQKKFNLKLKGIQMPYIS